MTEFPLSTVAECERGLAQVINSLHTTRITNHCALSGIYRGVEYSHKETDALVLPMQCCDVLNEVQRDLTAMATWIREQHGE